MARKSGLGKGLGALFPTSNEETKEATVKKKKPARATTEKAKKSVRPMKEKPAQKSPIPETENTVVIDSSVLIDAMHSPTDTVLNSMQYLPLDQLEPNPDQPRKTFDPASLADLSQSIRTYGILQPIVVERMQEEGHAPYRIIAGERRFRAAEMAGLTTVPVVLRAEGQGETALLSVVENVQRQDLTPVEEAVAYRSIMEEKAMTQQDLAEALGKSRPYIANTIRLLQLDDASLEALRMGLLTASQGRTLLSEKDLKKRAAYRKLLIEGKTNVREVEKKNKNRTSNPYLDAAEEKITETLGTNVSIIPRRKGYTVQIACYNDEELNRFLERLVGETLLD